MNKEQLAEIKKRVEAATPGLETDGKYIRARGEPGGRLPALIGALFDTQLNWENDANFFAHARADIPALLAEIERLTIGINDLVKRWRDYANEPAASKVGRIVAGDCADELVMLIVA